MSDLEQRIDNIAAAVGNMQKQQSEQQSSSRENQIKLVAQKLHNDVDIAEKALAEAYEEGDGGEIAKAQRELTEKIATREKGMNTIREMTESEGRKLDDTNLKDWKQRHAAWYGVDAEMTKASHEIDRQIRDAGQLAVGSPEYFHAVDRAMSQRYPDKMGGTPPTAFAAGGQRNTPQRGRISKSIADGWRRMGINVDDPATVERMMKNRQKAVEKGILSPEMNVSPIVSR